MAFPVTLKSKLSEIHQELDVLNGSQKKPASIIILIHPKPKHSGIASQPLECWDTQGFPEAGVQETQKSIPSTFQFGWTFKEYNKGENQAMESGKSRRRRRKIGRSPKAGCALKMQHEAEVYNKWETGD